MNENTNKEKLLLDFYKEIVTLSQKDLKSGTLFFEQAMTSMIFGYELKREPLHSVPAYERLLLWNLSYNNVENIKDNNSINNILGPFALIDQNNHYTDLLLNDLLLNMEILMICKVSDDLEKNDDMSFTMQITKLKHKDLITAYQAISKMKTILRKGWIKRNVKKEYIENDSIHTMQMFLLASAYFNIYNVKDLDLKKVFEMIMIHEIGELLADDITELDPRHDTKHDIEYIAVKNIFSPLKSGPYFISMWEEFEERKTNEAKFVYSLDKLDPILKAKYLDEVLNRDDLFEDFYTYEENRKTFEDDRFKKLSYYIKSEYFKK